jgi:DNA-binding LacI/PurR family transcriptional regulator
MTDNGTHALLAPARRSHVLASLSRDGVVRISDLIDELGVSPVTLRRDLAQMEEEGLLVRVHGGAVPPAEEPDSDQEAPSGEPAPPPAGTIAVLVPSLAAYWPGVVRGMQAEAARRGMRLLVRAASYEMQDERPVLERLVATEDVRGLIVAPNPGTPHSQDVIQWMQEIGVPSVLVERDAVVMPAGTPMETAVADHALGAMLAARHLAKLGHRKVGLIVARDSPHREEIVRGWQSACGELGLDQSQHFEERFPPRTSPDFSARVDAVLETTLARGVTGLLVHSDAEAMAFIDLALDRGLSVPGDLSVISYDDEVASLFTPPLTAVRPPREAIGAAAVDLLLRRIEDPARPVHRVIVSPELNVRDSTAPVSGE